MSEERALHDLGSEVAASLETARLERGGIERVRDRLREADPSRFRRPLRLNQTRIVAMATTLAVAAAGLLAVRVFTEPPNLAFEIAGKSESGVVGAFVAAPADAEVPLVFSDGTRIGVAPNGRLRVVDVEPSGARLVLESGEAHVNVIHRPKTQWRIDAGPFSVHVTGTTFDVAWDPRDEGLVVNMASGTVVVTGCDLGDGRRVSSGEHMHATCKHPQPVAAVPNTASAPEPPPPVVALSAPTSLAIAAPTPAPVLETADELLSRGERARLAGSENAAVDAFTSLRARFPGSDASAAAAFELGRIAADKRGDFVTAATMFETCFHERPQGNLAREAMGRAIEARDRTGDTARTEALATEYLKLHPAGPHAALARRLAAKGAP